MARHYLITGCSGGGKSTLCAGLAARGVAVVAEPGRRIIASGGPMPWADPEGFARRAVELARADLVAAGPGLTVFDRGVIDAAVALEHAAGVPVEETLGESRPYARQVFLAPPWLEIFEGDDARRHGFAEGEAEYLRIAAVLARLGYEAQVLEKVPVAAREEAVMRVVG